MSTKKKVLIGLGIYALINVAMIVIFGSDGKNDAFQPQNEFKLDNWVEITIAGIDMSINKAVLYLVLAATMTCVTMIFIANRMAAKPNRVQMAVELAYDVTKNMIVGDNMQEKWAKRWFGFIASLFFFIWFSNMIGLIPLPTNTEHKVDIFGIEFPSFALYAATANISLPLVLATVVCTTYHLEGVREHGPINYLGSFLPSGLETMPAIGKVLIWVIELISHTVRLISLSVRLFANILAGHLLILFMGGGLAVLLGLAALGTISFPLVVAFYAFEVGLVATLQAFIFSILTAIYIGSATSHGH